MAPRGQIPGVGWLAQIDKGFTLSLFFSIPHPAFGSSSFSDCRGRVCFLHPEEHSELEGANSPH